MERITELFVVVEDRPGALGELLGHLTKEKINIEAIGLFQDIAKLSVSDTDRAFTQKQIQQLMLYPRLLEIHRDFE